MSEPEGFSWVEESKLAGMARPYGPEDLLWLREHGIELVISLTEYPVRRNWINEAGLFVLHLPVEDMCAPSPKQIEKCLSMIHNAHEKDVAVAVHCTAGLGRTGTMLACYFVAKGMSASEAISHLRKLRPGSIETKEQEDAIHEFERYRKDNG